MNIELSIIIPVFEESYIINKTISHLNCIPFTRRPEIIIVDGNITQSTLGVIRDKHVKKLSSPKGRGIQMNMGAKAASGNVFLFLHADTYLSPNAPELILKSLQNKNTVAGAFDLGIRSHKNIFRLIEKMVQIRSRLTRIPYGDQGIFIQKKFFKMLGGYSNMPLMEDVDLMRRVKKAGGKIAIIGEKVSTSSRRWEKEGIIFCTLRNWFLITLYFLGLPAEKLKKYYPTLPF
ncbi:MAG: TIGR04283 family arsenosugar biosynthesis glycosyltransferase [Desulfobacterales bacterium]